MVLKTTVAASTVEAEYMAAAAAVNEALCLRKLLPEMHLQTASIPIMVDNQGALKLLEHPITSARSTLTLCFLCTLTLCRSRLPAHLSGMQW